MLNQSFSISYGSTESADSGATGGWWLSLIQEKHNQDIAQLEEVAALIDALFDLDPCDGTQLPNGGEGTPDEPPVTEEEFDEIVSEYVTNESCELLTSGYTVFARLYLSDPGFHYEIEILEGESGIGGGTIQETVTENIVLDNQSEYTLNMPVLGGIVIEPSSTIYTSAGAPDDFAVTYDTGRLRFGTEVTGTLIVTFQTQYTRIAVELLKDDQNNPKEGLIRALYHGLVEDLTLEVPQVDPSVTPSYCEEYGGGAYHVSSEGPDPDGTCTERTSVREVCQCSGDTSRYFSEMQSVACRDGDRNGTEYYDASYTDERYVDCGEIDDVKFDSFYKETCCEDKPPDMILPYCEEHTGVFPGGEPIENGKEWWEARFAPRKVIFIGLAPPDMRGICGKHITTQILPDTDCCGPGLPDLEWVQTYDELDLGTTYVFKVQGGTANKTWTALVPETLIITGSGNEVRVEMTSCLCAPTQLIVTDDCDNQITHDIKALDGYWDSDDESVWCPPSSAGCPDHPFGLALVPAEAKFPRGFGGITGGNVSGYYAGIRVTCTGDEWLTWWVYARLSYANYGSVTEAEAISYICNDGAASYVKNLPPGCWPDDLLDWQDGDDWASGGWNLCADGVSLYRAPGRWNVDQGETPTVAAEGLFPGFLGGGWVYDNGGAAAPWECPDEPEELLYDEANSADTIADNSSAIVFWEGGKAPFTVTVSGQAIYTNPQRIETTQKTSLQYFTIYSGNTCGAVSVIITDACGDSVEGSLLAGAGDWELQSYERINEAATADAFGGFSSIGDTYFEGWTTESVQDIQGDKGMGPVSGGVGPSPDVGEVFGTGGRVGFCTSGHSGMTAVDKEWGIWKTHELLQEHYHETYSSQCNQTGSYSYTFRWLLGYGGNAEIGFWIWVC